ncbi:MAG: serine/threonine protein kinase [Planctomycetes bacterium]|nr:serine/threonine protein kinase [Planctomycetota bacterium]
MRSLAPGAAFGPYDLVAELGRGGVGAVFRARERASGREVAVKVLLDAGGATPEDLERFRREGELAAGLVHPGIVRVHAAGDVGGLMFLACELVEGARDLATAARGLPPLERARLVRDVARALGHAHARGVVHRDVKPDNLLVGADGRVRVSDFGVAGGRGLERLTRTGAIVGTPRYMAPEQIDGDRARVGAPADVWALGVVLFEVLAGARPFEADGLTALYGRIVVDPTPDLRARAPDAPRALAAVVERALEKRPERRYPDAEALADDLDRALAGEGTLAGAARGRRAARRVAPPRAASSSSEPRP